MAFTKSGMNLSGLDNLTNLNFSSSFVPSDIINNSVTTMNTDAGIWALGLILVCIYILIFWALSETSPLAKFRYSYLRASLLAICIINLLSITMISIGFLWSFRLVAIFVIINMLNTILVLSLDN
jgi:hypothetical protein